MTMYTVVAYRPNNNHYGDRTHSEFELNSFEEGETKRVAEQLNVYRKRDRDDGNEYASWEVTLLVDGYEKDWWTGNEELDKAREELFDKIRVLAYELWDEALEEAHAAKLKAEEEAKRLADAQALVAAKEKEKRERAELARLKEKYKDK
jgi:hypothetical protein